MKKDDLIRLQIVEAPASYCRQRTNQMLHTDIGDQPILHAPATERSTVSLHCHGCRVARCNWWILPILSDPRLRRCRVLSDAPPNVRTFLSLSRVLACQSQVSA
jgi:hypothetical protein